MDYALAKELKEGGYPQPECNIDFGVLPKGEVWCGRHLKSHQWFSTETDQVYVPTLEELIEACGKDLIMITNNPDDWKAVGRGVFTQAGSNPTEAVARLWLALNKK